MKNNLGIAFVSSLCWIAVGCGGGTPGGMDMKMAAMDSAMGAADLAVAEDLAMEPEDLAGVDLLGVDLAAPDLKMMMGGNMVHVGPNGNFSFEPAMLTIKAGDTVTWIWDSSGHSVVSGKGGMPDLKFCSPSDMNCDVMMTSNAGAMYSHKFDQAGVYDYFCNPHFFTGQVIVQ